MTTYRVTASTLFAAASPAEAREWFAEKIALDECPYTVETEAREETTAPSEHPAGLAFHHWYNARQILRGDYLEAGDLARANELLDEGMHDLAALYQLFIRQERLIEEQRIETVTLAHDRYAEQRTRERIEQINSRLVSRHNAARATAHQLVEQLRALPLTPESFMRPMSVALTLEKA